jgi:hypothetical protein
MTLFRILTGISQFLAHAVFDIVIDDEIEFGQPG